MKEGGERQRVLLVEVDPSYISQMCPYCGYTSKSNWSGYSYLKCRACGFEANRDRLASLNIALRTAQTQDTSRADKMGQFPWGEPTSVGALGKVKGLKGRTTQPRVASPQASAAGN